MFANKNPKSAFLSAAVAALVLLVTTSALGQTETNTRPPPPSNPPNFRVPAEPDWTNLGPRSSERRSSIVEIKSSLNDLRENIRLLQVINEELQRIVSSPSWPDYVTVVADASDIRRLAVRLLRNLALPHAEPAPARTGSSASAGELKTSIIALDTTIQTFLNDPVLTQPGTVDVRQLSNVGASLETLATRSAEVRKEADDLAAMASKANGGRPTKRIKSRLGPGTSIQVAVECGAWSMNDLLKRPSRVKGHDSADLGMKVQTTRHQLNEQALLPIDDCLDGETYEKAVTDKLQYLAIVTDFTSFEVKDRVFAYAVRYEIGYARNGQVAKRFNQPVVFYYVDEAGDGDFEVLKESVTRSLVPDWAKELARKH